MRNLNILGAVLTLGLLAACQQPEAPSRVHTIRFDVSGAYGTMAPQSAAEGDKVTLGSVFANEGFAFIGWAKSAQDATDRKITWTNGATVTMGGADLVLYAIWVPIRAVDFNGGPLSQGNMSRLELPEGTTRTLPDPTFTRGMLRVIGWAKTQADADKGKVDYPKGIPFTMGTANVSLYAVWSPQVTQVTLADGVTGVTLPPAYGKPTDGYAPSALARGQEYGTVWVADKNALDAYQVDVVSATPTLKGTTALGSAAVALAPDATGLWALSGGADPGKLSHFAYGTAGSPAAPDSSVNLSEVAGTVVAMVFDPSAQTFWVVDGGTTPQVWNLDTTGKVLAHWEVVDTPLILPLALYLETGGSTPMLWISMGHTTLLRVSTGTKTVVAQYTYPARIGGKARKIEAVLPAGGDDFWAVDAAAKEVVRIQIH